MVDTSKSDIAVDSSKTDQSELGVSAGVRTTSDGVKPMPAVRGSFQAFDCERAKTAKVVLAQTIPSETDSQRFTEKQSSPSTIRKSEISPSSWLHKAKDGTTTLAKMFIKPSS